MTALAIRPAIHPVGNSSARGVYGGCTPGVRPVFRLGGSHV